MTSWLQRLETAASRNDTRPQSAKTDKHTLRLTARQTPTHTETHTDKPRLSGRQTCRQTDRYTHSQPSRLTMTLTGRQKLRLADTNTHRKAPRQTPRGQADELISPRIYTDWGRHAEWDRETKDEHAERQILESTDTHCQTDCQTERQTDAMRRTRAKIKFDNCLNFRGGDWTKVKDYKT